MAHRRVYGSRGNLVSRRQLEEQNANLLENLDLATAARELQDARIQELSRDLAAQRTSFEEFTKMVYQQMRSHALGLDRHDVELTDIRARLLKERFAEL